MDFAFDADQQALQGLAKQVFAFGRRLAGEAVLDQLLELPEAG